MASNDLSTLSHTAVLPADFDKALLIGRLWHGQDTVPGVSPVRITANGVFDLSGLAPTCAQLMNLPDVAKKIRAYDGGRRLGDTEALIRSTLDGGDEHALRRPAGGDRSSAPCCPARRDAAYCRCRLSMPFRVRRCPCPEPGRQCRDR